MWPEILISKGSISSQTVGAEVARRAHALLKQGATAPLLIPARRSLDSIYWIYAAWSVGRIFLPVAEDLSAVELSQLKEQLGTFSELPAIGADTTHDYSQIPEIALAAIVMSSGTTAAPKLIAFTRKNFLASARGHALQHDLASKDTWLASLPFHTIGGLSVLLRALVLGQSIAFSEKNDVNCLREWLEGGRIQGISLVPSQLKKMLELVPVCQPHPSVRTILIGGASLDSSFKKNAIERAWPIVTSYGMTEACAQVWSRKKVMPGMELTLADDGEVLVRGENLAAGFWRSGQLVSFPLTKDGFFQTNDMGGWDESGALQIYARKSEIIISGGVNVSPQEVEAAISRFPGIADVCVVGLSDPSWGEKVVAAIVEEENVDIAKLDDFLREQLSPPKRPKEIKKFQDLPRTRSGKLIRHKVVQLFS